MCSRWPRRQAGRSEARDSTGIAAHIVCTCSTCSGRVCVCRAVWMCSVHTRRCKLLRSRPPYLHAWLEMAPGQAGGAVVHCHRRVLAVWQNRATSRCGLRVCVCGRVGVCSRRVCKMQQTNTQPLMHLQVYAFLTHTSRTHAHHWQSTTRMATQHPHCHATSPFCDKGLYLHCAHDVSGISGREKSCASNQCAAGSACNGIAIGRILEMCAAEGGDARTQRGRRERSVRKCRGGEGGSSRGKNKKQREYLHRIPCAQSSLLHLHYAKQRSCSLGRFCACRPPPRPCRSAPKSAREKTTLHIERGGDIGVKARAAHEHVLREQRSYCGE